MKIKLLLIPLAALLCLASCKSPDTEKSIPCNEQKNALLSTTEDFGEEYLNSFIFFGESTTYHLKSRGVLKGGVNTTQVWAPKNGTANLDFSTKELRIFHPETKNELTLAEACAISKPKYLVITFGLNGAVQKIKKGKEVFKTTYKALTDSVKQASKDTKIILQSAFPIAKNMDMSNYTVDADTLNRYIDTINSWTFELACQEGFGYLNTAEILKDANGCLNAEYQCGDGHHLTTEAYRKILEYIRTHGYK